MKKTVLTLFLSLFLFSPALCNDEKTVIRVGLSNQNYSSYQYQNIKLTSDNNISLIDMGKISSESGSQTANFEANSIIEVVLSEGNYNIYVNNELKLEKLVGPLLFSSNQDMQVVGLNRKGPAKYKGMIEIKTTTKNPGYFNLINVVDMQNYLRGVVPNEMPISFGIEALKAQAIAARNYAANAQMSDNYDLVDSTASQVYYGSNSY
ncbi:MAG: SpoIID/LytB domain-containing protein, partial [Candidatus Gastranaerophilales bacterium]|nr:SpoIID/LytB domain-containing protein [Candidatus Gastranaerophilales bacterium]